MNYKMLELFLTILLWQAEIKSIITLQSELEVKNLFLVSILLHYAALKFVKVTCFS